MVTTAFLDVNYTIPSNINLSDSSFYFIYRNQTGEIYSPIGLPFNLLEIMNDGVNDYINFRVYSFDYYGDYRHYVYGFNRTASDIGGYPYTGITDRTDFYGGNGDEIYAIVLNLSLPDQPQQNIQSSNFEILGSTGLGLSRFFGSLTSSLSGLLLIFAIVGAIVLVLGGVVFLVMYAINYAKTR